MKSSIVSPSNYSVSRVSPIKTMMDVKLGKWVDTWIINMESHGLSHQIWHSSTEANKVSNEKKRGEVSLKNTNAMKNLAGSKYHKMI